MSNLRGLARKSLRWTENAWGMKVILTDPDGKIYNKSKDSGKPLSSLHTLTDYKRINPETGEEIVVAAPILAMRIDALERKPVAGEVWHVKIQENPNEPESWKDYLISGDHSPEEGSSVGFVKLYLMDVEQNDAI